MAADDPNPFAGPWGQGGPFADPLTDPARSTAICCPVCKSQEFEARSTPYEVLRICKKCGNKWSGGTMGVARPDLTSQPPPPPGSPAPLEDEQPMQFTGADFRNPGKNFGGGDDW